MSLLSPCLVTYGFISSALHILALDILRSIFNPMLRVCVANISWYRYRCDRSFHFISLDHSRKMPSIVLIYQFVHITLLSNTSLDQIMFTLFWNASRSRNAPRCCSSETENVEQKILLGLGNFKSWGRCVAVEEQSELLRCLFSQQTYHRPFPL